MDYPVVTTMASRIVIVAFAEIRRQLRDTYMTVNWSYLCFPTGLMIDSFLILFCPFYIEDPRQVKHCLPGHN